MSREQSDQVALANDGEDKAWHWWLLVPAVVLIVAALCV